MTADLLTELQRGLADVDRETRAFFAQCTPAEQRGMACMARHKLFASAAGDATSNERLQLALCLTAHAWWINGLVLQRDRKAEVKRAIRAGSMGCSVLAK